MLAAFHSYSQDSLSTETCFSLPPELLSCRNPEKYFSENPKSYSAGVKRECSVPRPKKPQLKPGFHTLSNYVTKDTLLIPLRLVFQCL